MIGTHWIIFSIILTMCSSSDAFRCLREWKCKCNIEFDTSIDLNCPTGNNSSFVVTIKPYENIHIKCQNYPQWPQFHLFNLFLDGDIETMTISECGLPMNSSISEISNTFNAENIYQLELYNLNAAIVRNHLKGFPKLQQLTLSSIGLKYLSIDLFADIPHLAWLDLKNNQVHLPLGIFNNTPELERLDLSGNMINHLEPGIFDPLTKLQLLSLGINNFTEFKPGIFDNLASLSMLDLSWNNLTSLPENIFAKLESLEWLMLFNNSFNSLPKGMLKNNPNLMNINLSHNTRNMTLPQKFFANLTRIKFISLDHNGCSTVPEDLFWGSISLEHINLAHNYFEMLPNRIFEGLHYLLELRLNSNRLMTLPDRIFSDATNLTILDLSENCLTSISRALFTNLKSLRILNMEGNQLQAFKDMNYILHKSLPYAKDFENRRIFLSGFFEEAPFYDCTSLEELHLAQNNISELYYYWLSFNSDLRLLNLSYNNIPQLSTENMIFAPSNITLDLRHNKIQHIQLNKNEETEDYEVIKGHVKILVTNNPIVCDCNLYNFLYYLDGRMRPAFQQFFHIMAENLTCHGPEWTNGIVMNQLQWNTFKCPKSKPCPTECSCWIKPNDKVFLVDCSYKNLTTTPTNINAIPYYRLEINFMGNQFIKIPLLTEINSNNAQIVKLRLANNNISDVSVKELSLNVEVLELHNNSIKRLKSEVVQYLRNSTTPKTLTLHGNPWTCDCDKDFLDFIQSQTPQRILNLSMIECKDIKIPILKIRMEDLCPNNVMLFIGASFAIVIPALIISTVIALYYRYQREIKVWLYAHESCLWLVTEDELDKDKPYDAFISYSHKDEDFVVNELIPKLESGPRPFKLCVHFRNWLAGEYIPTQIARSIENSRRTIVILSTNFINSIWGRMEFKAAHCQALSEGRTRVILILYGEINIADHLDPDLKAYLKMHTYIKWGDPWFWDKLRYALPHCPELQNNCNYQEAVSESFALDVIGQ